MTLSFFKALTDALQIKKDNNKNNGLYTYYVTEFGRTEGERLFRQFNAGIKY